jgi:hypothetical protein
MKIRELQEDEVPALAGLAAKTYAETFGHSFTPEELQAQIRETRSEAYFRTALDRPHPQAPSPPPYFNVLGIGVVLKIDGSCGLPFVLSPLSAPGSGPAFFIWVSKPRI